MASLICIDNVVRPEDGGRRELVELDSPTTIAELISSQKVALDRPTVCALNGQPVLRGGWETTLVAPEDVVCFIALPAGGGGGGSNPLRTVLMLGMMVAAWEFAPGIAAEIGFAGSATATGLISAGLMLGGSMLVNSLLPPPSAAKGGALPSPSPTYSLTGAGNMSRLGQPIPVLYGRHQIVPDFAAQPYTYYAGNDQYLCQLFCLGQGACTFEEPKLGDDLFSSFGIVNATSGDAFYHIYAPGEVVALYPQAVYAASLGAATLATGVNSSEVIANPSTTTIDTILIDVVCGRGLYYANDSGGLDSKTVAFTIYGRTVDDNGVATSAYAPISSPTISGATTTPIRQTITLTVSAARWQVYLVRTDTQDTSSRAGHEVSWYGLTGLKSGGRTYPNENIMYVRMKADAGLSAAKSRTVNVVGQRLLPTWTQAGGWTAPVATRNPAWALCDVAKNTVYGGGYSDAQLDLPKIAALAATWDSRGDYFDGIFDTAGTLFAAFQSVAMVGRAKPFVQLGALTLARDEAQTIPVAHFSPRNIVSGSLTTEYLVPTPQYCDEVEVTYHDNISWMDRVVDSNLFTSSPQNLAQVKLFGCTDRQHAWREAMYQSAANRYRRKQLTFVTELEGHLPTIMSLCRVTHDVLDVGQSGDVAGYDAPSLTLTLEAEVAWTTGAQHAICLRRPDGSSFGPVNVTQGADASHCILASAPDFTPLTALGTEERTHYTFGVTGSTGSLVRIISVKPRDQLTVEISAVVEDSRVHAADGTGSPAADIQGDTLPGLLSAPTIALLFVTQAGTPAMPVLNISWTPAAGANAYQLQYSADNANWVTLAEQPGCDYSWAAPPNQTLWVRVRAYGLMAGPWQTWTGSVQTQLAPGLVTGLALTDDGQGSVAAVKWLPAPRADYYEVQVLHSGILARDASTINTHFSYSAQDSQADGGPWRQITIQVRAVNAAGTSTAWTSVTVGNAAPVISGSPVLTPLLNGLLVDWSAIYPTDRDLQRFDVLCGTSNPPTTVAASVAAGAAKCAVFGLTPNIVYNVMVLPYDTYGAGTASTVVQGTPAAVSLPDVASLLTGSVAITDSQGTLAATLAQLYDRVETTGGPSYTLPGADAGDVRIEYDFGVGFLVDRLAVWVSGPISAYASVDDGNGTLTYFAGPVTSGAWTAVANRAAAVAAPVSLAAGMNIGTLPPMTHGVKFRLYLTGTGSAQVYELKFFREVAAEEVVADTLAAISADMGTITAGLIRSPSWLSTGGQHGVEIDLTAETIRVGAGILLDGGNDAATRLPGPNMVRTGYFDGLTAVGSWSAGSLTTVTGEPFAAALRLSVRDAYELPPTPCTAGDGFAVSAYISTIGCTAAATVGIVWGDVTGAVIAWMRVAELAAGQNWTECRGRCNAPAGAVQAAPWLQIDGTSGFGYADFAQIQILGHESGATVGAPTGTYVGMTLAESVEANAASAVTLAQNMSADGILSAQEKATWRLQWPGWLAQHDQYQAQATTWGLSADAVFTGLATAQTTLLNYLTSLGVWSAPTVDATITPATQLTTDVQAFWSAMATASTKLAAASNQHLVASDVQTGAGWAAMPASGADVTQSAMSSGVTITAGGVTATGTGGDVMLDAANGQIIVSQPGGHTSLATVDYAALQAGDISFYRYDGTAHQVQKSLKRTVYGVCSNGATVNVGYFKSAPQVIMSPAALQSFSAAYAAQDQTLSLNANNIRQSGTNWFFDASATLSLNAAISNGGGVASIPAPASLPYGALPYWWGYAYSAQINTPSTCNGMTIWISGTIGGAYLAMPGRWWECMGAQLEVALEAYSGGTWTTLITGLLTFAGWVQNPSAPFSTSLTGIGSSITAYRLRIRYGVYVLGSDYTNAADTIAASSATLYASTYSLASGTIAASGTANYLAIGD